MDYRQEGYRLVRYAGRLWFFFGLRDRYGRLDLVDIRDSSRGVCAKPDKCQELVGPEYERHLAAIYQWKGWHAARGTSA